MIFSLAFKTLGMLIFYNFFYLGFLFIPSSFQISKELQIDNLSPSSTFLFVFLDG